MVGIEYWRRTECVAYSLMVAYKVSTNEVFTGLSYRDICEKVDTTIDLLIDGTSSYPLLCGRKWAKVGNDVPSKLNRTSPSQKLLVNNSGSVLSHGCTLLDPVIARK